MKKRNTPDIPVGTQALILSKLYYGVLSKSLENLDIERYFSVLYFLYYNNGCTQQKICNNLVIDKTAMVKVMDYLVKADFIERRVNPEDRREHFISLTEKGHTQTIEVVTAFKAIDEQSFSGISNDDKAVFMKVMQSMSVNLENMPANDLFFNYIKTGKASEPVKTNDTNLTKNETT